MYITISVSSNVFHNNNITYSNSLIDKPQLQLQYIFASQNKNQLQRPQAQLPWINPSIMADFLRALPAQQRDSHLKFYWNSPNYQQLPLFKVILCNFGLQSVYKEIWKERLQSSIIQIMAQQSQNFQLQEHWYKALY